MPQPPRPGARPSADHRRTPYLRPEHCHWPSSTHLPILCYSKLPRAYLELDGRRSPPPSMNEEVHSVTLSYLCTRYLKKIWGADCSGRGHRCEGRGSTGALALTPMRAPTCGPLGERGRERSGAHRLEAVLEAKTLRWRIWATSPWLGLGLGLASGLGLGFAEPDLTLTLTLPLTNRDGRQRRGTEHLSTAACCVAAMLAGRTEDGAAPHGRVPGSG